MDTFLTIAENTVAEGIYKEKGSRFLAFAYYVEDEQAIKMRLEALRKEYFDARHHCYAYILGKDKTQFRANDDGEPNGTAGLPILNQIKSKNLSNILVVVIRYFGGTKLGASGLVAAYKIATQEALNQATIVEKIVQEQLNIQFDYLQMNEVMKIIKDFNLEMKSQNFDNQCTISLVVRQGLLDMAKEKFSKIANLSITTLLILLFNLVGFISTAQNKFIDKDLQKVYDSIDKRTPFKNALPKKVTEQISSQELQDINFLLAILQDSTSKAKTRKNIAYAIGQIAQAETAPLLIQLFDNEIDNEVKKTLLEAIGKTGYISDILEADFNNEELAVAQMKALYRAATWKRNTTDRGTEKAILALNHNNKDLRFWAASYLARNPKKNYTENQVDTLLVKLQSEKDAFVRMNIASALNSAINVGENKTNKALDVLLKVAIKDNHELVRINAIRALNRFDTTATQNALLKALEDDKPNVAIVASEFIRGHARKNDKIDYIYWSEKLQHPQIRANILAAAILFEKKLEMSKAVQKYFKKTKSVYEKGFLLNALANSPSNFGFIRQQIDVKNPNPLNTFAFDALMLIRNNPNFDNLTFEESKKTPKETFKASFEALLVEILNGGDNVLIGLAATELRNEKRNYKNSVPTALESLKKAKEKLPIPLEIEAVIEIQKTIDFFEGKTSEKPPIIGYNNPIDWTFVEKLAEKPQVKIKTTKGLIVVELFTNEASASVANFLKLIQDGFYKDKVFHRVVQNFVIQTGCPRGDGYGNVPFSIRSELADLHYGEGYLGMASAGKDTEGSQWFITHSPTPHLDGRYTIFGRVVSGMEVVQKIEIGDKILKVE